MGRPVAKIFRGQIRCGCPDFLIQSVTILANHMAGSLQNAGKALGFQVIMISHHDIAVFEQYADKIFQFVPTGGGAVSVREFAPPAREQDH